MLVRGSKVLTPGLTDKIINNIVWTILNIIVFGFVMPKLGLPENFGTFIAITMPASAAFFISINCIYGLLYDVTSEGSNLRYELTLPIPQWITFAKYGIENAAQAFIVASAVFPAGYIIIWQQFSLTLLGLLKLYVMLFATSLFAGFFALFIVSHTKDFFGGLDNVWTRIIFPMWFLGGFQFAWLTLYKISPTFAYLNLLNPLTYALEGCRASIMYTDTSLSYSHCLLALIFFTILFGYIGIQRLKRRMDCL